MARRRPEDESATMYDEPISKMCRADVMCRQPDYCALRWWWWCRCEDEALISRWVEDSDDEDDDEDKISDAKR